MRGKGYVILTAGAWLLTVVAVVAPRIHAGPLPPAALIEERCRPFEATGYSVCGPFRDFFEAHGGLRIFGYPLTTVFYDARIGLFVQFFDNARMEWHPENPDPYKVQLGLLGEILGHRQPPLPRNRWPRNTYERRVFPETGHVVSYAFLNFYDQNGGLDVFGYPISEPLIENGYTVQYFQRMRMEWHPERARDDRVTLGALGREYIDRYGLCLLYTSPSPRD